MKYTVFGSSGFIGSHIAQTAKALGHDVVCPGRHEMSNGGQLGHVIYCIGMTADFRSRPHETVDAHISQLQRVLQTSDFTTFTYLSSTRVYQHCTDAVVTEETPLAVCSQDSGDLYNISKLMGESLLQMHGAGVRIARLSNVVGNDISSNNFLFSVLRDCVSTGSVTLHQSLDSVKDYIDIQDVVDVLLQLGPEGSPGIYNVASGTNVSHRQIMEVVSRLTSAEVRIADDAVPYSFPEINIQRLREEFQFQSRSVLDTLPALVDQTHQFFRTAA